MAKVIQRKKRGENDQMPDIFKHENENLSKR